MVWRSRGDRSAVVGPRVFADRLFRDGGGEGNNLRPALGLAGGPGHVVCVCQMRGVEGGSVVRTSDAAARCGRGKKGVRSFDHHYSLTREKSFGFGARTSSALMVEDRWSWLGRQSGIKARSTPRSVSQRCRAHCTGQSVTARSSQLRDIRAALFPFCAKHLASRSKHASARICPHRTAPDPNCEILVHTAMHTYLRDHCAKNAADRLHEQVKHALFVPEGAANVHPAYHHPQPRTPCISNASALHSTAQHRTAQRKPPQPNGVEHMTSAPQPRGTRQPRNRGHKIGPDVGQDYSPLPPFSPCESRGMAVVYSVMAGVVMNAIVMTICHVSGSVRVVWVAVP